MGIANKQTLFSLAVIAALGVAISSPAIAGKPGPGQQVSLDAWTSCAVDFDNAKMLAVTKVRNKHVGEKAGNPVVTYASISGRAKIGPGKWSNANTAPLGTYSGPTSIEVPQDGGADIFPPEPFDLCPFVNEPNLSGLNADAYIQYSDSGSGDPKSISNSCGDDPETTDVIEPNGIKLDAYDIVRLQKACGY